MMRPQSLEPVQTETIEPFVHDVTCRDDAKNDQDYNFFKVPADLLEAKKHGVANRVYVHESELMKTLNPNKVCQCCNRKQGVKIGLCAGLDAIYHLGSGHVLYFRFIKYSIGMLVLMLILGGFFNLITNVAEGDCSSKSADIDGVYCVKGYILSFTLQNKRDSKSLLNTQLVLNLTTVVLIMLFFHYLRYQFRKMKKAADLETVKPSDYTVEVQNIPLKATNEEIAEWVAGVGGKDQKMEIERIIRPYSINEYIDLVFKKSNLETKKRNLLKTVKRIGLKEEKHIKQNDIEIQKTVERIQDLKDNDLIKCPIIFITFKTSKQAKVMTRFEKRLRDKVKSMFVRGRDYAIHKYGANEVRARRAPEPTDILWGNFRFDRQKKKLTKFVTFMITLSMIVLSSAIILVMNWLQRKAKENYGEDSEAVEALSFGASLVISLTNILLKVIITNGAKRGGHWTHSHYLRDIAHVLTIAQFLNTALSTLIAEIILSQTGSLSNTLQKLNFYGRGGLLENIYWVFILNMALMAILAVFDPEYIVKWIQRYVVRKQGKKNKVTQMEANLLHEGPVLDMPDQYAGIIRVVLLTTFYSAAIPFAFIISVLGLAVIFWVDKYMLLRRMAFPKFLNNETTESMIEYLEWAAASFSVGNLIYFYTLRNSDDELAFSDTHSVIPWATFIVSMLHVNLPMEAVNKKLFRVKKAPHSHPDFKVARQKFRTDYDNELFFASITSLKEPIKQSIKSKDSPFKKVLQRIYSRIVFGNSYQSNFVKKLSSDKQEKIEDEDLDYLDKFMGNLKHILDHDENIAETEADNSPTPMPDKVADICKEQVDQQEQDYPVALSKGTGAVQEIEEPNSSIADICQIEIKEEEKPDTNIKINQDQHVSSSVGTAQIDHQLEKQEEKKNFEATFSVIMNEGHLAKQRDSSPKNSGIKKESE